MIEIKIDDSKHKTRFWSLWLHTEERKMQKLVIIRKELNETSYVVTKGSGGADYERVPTLEIAIDRGIQALHSPGAGIC